MRVAFAQGLQRDGAAGWTLTPRASSTEGTEGAALGAPCLRPHLKGGVAEADGLPRRIEPHHHVVLQLGGNSVERACRWVGGGGGGGGGAGAGGGAACRSARAMHACVRAGWG